MDHYLLFLSNTQAPLFTITFFAIMSCFRSEIDNIDSIIITLDTHFPGHIAQSCFWEDQGGRNPAAFSIISHSDVLEGKWRPRDITLQVMVNKRYFL